MLYSNLISCIAHFVLVAADMSLGSVHSAELQSSRHR